MLKYDNTVSSTVDGKPIYGAQVNVYDGSGAVAPIYADAMGTTPASQPVLTDQLGYFSFYIPDGLYEVRVQTGAIEISRTNITMVDTLGLKERALLVPMNEDGGTLPPAGQRLGMVLAFDQATGAPTALLPNSFSGPTGPANSTYTTLAAIAAADITNLSAILSPTEGSGLARTTYHWTPGNFTGRNDVIASNYVAISAGAWDQQGADGLASKSQVSANIIRSAQSLFEGSPDLLDIIGGAEKTKIQNGSSTVPIDDALDDYLTWMGTNQKRGMLRMSGGRAKLNRAHTIDTRRAQMMLSGEFDMSGIPDNSIALTIKGQSVNDSGGRSTSRTAISGLSLIGPAGTPGPNWGRGCTAIKYVDCDHLLMSRLTIRDFVTGITNGANAYIIEHLGGRITGCKVGYYGANAVNAGERITFANYTIDAMRAGWVLDSPISDVNLIDCSADYPVDLTNATADGKVRFLEVLDGRMAVTACHFEGGNSGNPMGGVSPFYQGPNDSSSLVMDKVEVLFAQNIVGVPIFENLNPVNPMVVDHLRMQGGYGFDNLSNGISAPNTSVLGVGNVEIGLRPVRGAPAPGYGPTFNGAIVSRYNNKFKGLADVGLAEDGAATAANGGITSGTIGTNIKLVASGVSDANGVPQFYADKSGALGVLATFNIAIPIRGNRLAGFETFLTKTAALTGEISISAVYAAVHRQGNYVLVVDRVGSAFADAMTVDLATLNASTPKRVAFGGISRRSEPWANCAIVSIQMRKAAGSTDTANPAQLFLSSTCMTEI